MAARLAHSVARRLAAQYNGDSLSNGALMRVSPLAAWAARLPQSAAAAAARADASLTPPNPVAQVRRRGVTNGVRVTARSAALSQVTRSRALAPRSRPARRRPARRAILRTT